MEEMMLEDDVAIEGVKKFCYLGDVISGDGSSNAASIARVRCGWKKFRELACILTHKKVSPRLKGRVYSTCVRSAMVYGSETWPMTAEQERRFERAEMRMVRWMCGVSLRDNLRSDELRRRLGIEAIGQVLRRGRLRWLGHVLRKEENDWVRKSMNIIVVGNRGRGRPKLTWGKVVERDMNLKGLRRDRVKWRGMSW